MKEGGPASKPEFAFSRLDFPELPGAEKNERSETPKAAHWGPLRSAPADPPLGRAAEVSTCRPAFSTLSPLSCEPCPVRLGPKGSCPLRGSPNARVFSGSSGVLWQVRRFWRECEHRTSDSTSPCRREDTYSCRGSFPVFPGFLCASRSRDSEFGERHRSTCTLVAAW